MKKVFIILGIILLAVGGFIGFQFFTKTGLFKIPGVITYADSVSSEEISYIESHLPEDLVLEYDVKISALTTDAEESNENYFLYDILVPVGDFYDSRSSVSAEEAEELLIPITSVTYEDKIFAIDGEYYLDTFSTGAFYRYLVFTGEDINEVKTFLPKREFPTKDTVLTFTQTGVTALSRGMYTKLSEVGGYAAYFSEGIAEFLSSKDYTHISNESSFSLYASASNICSEWRFVDTIVAMGVDIVELTGNHNLDCGAQAALDTIAKYEELGIQTVGGGSGVSDASIPLKINKKGTGITMIAFNYSTGGMTYTETPGANPYNEELIASQINEAKENGDYVIVDIQFNECNAYASDYEDPTCDAADTSASRDGYTQSAFFKYMIDLGADMVVGTAAHQAQTYELYNDGVIYYGLGNLLFDQVWWPGTARSLVLNSYFYKGQKLQTRITGTEQNTNLQAEIMDEEKLSWWIERLNAAR